MTARPRCLTFRRECLGPVIGRPLRILGRPAKRNMTADPLSDVLKTVRLTGATFFDVVARAPWVAEQPSPQTILPKILPGAAHLISYHVITEGRCFANIVGEEPIPVEAGEVIVFTRGDPHVMSSNPGMRAEPNPASMYDEGAANQPFFANLGDEGPIRQSSSADFWLAMPRPFNPLLDNLPPIIKVAAGEGSDTRWLSQFIHVATHETADKRAGGESVLAQLERADVHRSRSPLSRGLPPAQVGWLAGLRDPFVGKALSLMHASPRTTGQSTIWRGTSGCRARCWRSASTTWSAFRRSSISRNGACRSRQVF